MAHRLVYHPTLGLRAIKKREEKDLKARVDGDCEGPEEKDRSDQDSLTCATFSRQR